MIERRQRVLTQADLDDIVTALSSGLNQEQHAEHHRLFKSWLQQQEDKRKRREQIKAQVGGYAILTALGLIGTVTWFAFTSFIDTLLHRGGN